MLFYRQLGSGEPLMILHGLLGMSDNWVTFARTVSEKAHFQVIIPDMRNHGQSFHHPVHTYDALVSDVVELMDQLSITSAHLLGHSMGGKAAMAMALLHPERVKSLIVVDISPVPYRVYHHAQLFDVLLSTDLLAFRRRIDIQRYLEERVIDSRQVGLLMKNVKELTRQIYAWKMNVNALWNNLDHILDFPYSNLTFNKNVLWIIGGKSNYVLSGHDDVMRGFFPNVHHCLIEEATHWVHVDAPEIFEKCVIDFLEEQKDANS